MRSIILIVLAVLFVTNAAVPAFARSGCCSSHGGVNCSAGSQGNGNVICNDGWTGSSCAYSEMVMCGGSSNNTGNSMPTPVYIAPTNIPIPLPTWTPQPTPTVTPTPTVKPSETPTPTLTAIPTQTLTPTPVKPVIVGGAQQKNNGGIGNALGLAALAGGGYLFYKSKKKRKT